MERAAAVVVAGIGLVLLTLAALVFAGPDGDGRPGGVEVAALVTRPSVPHPPASPSAGPSDVAAGARPTDTVMPPATSVPTSSPTASVPTSSVPTSSVPTSSVPTTTAGGSPGELPAALVATMADISSGGIRFELGRAELDAGARSLLDRMAPLLAGRSDLVLIVRGHTDSSGTAEINAPLSVRRAQVVAEYLVARGVPAAQVQVAGYADAFPVADNGTDQGRQANRRSEVTAVERSG
jgi:outer membrane protein OmpA-like peptidoglycan-associated protein